MRYKDNFCVCLRDARRDSTRRDATRRAMAGPSPCFVKRPAAVGPREPGSRFFSSRIVSAGARNELQGGTRDTPLPTSLPIGTIAICNIDEEEVRKSQRA